MSHASNILLQPTSFDKNSIINKLNKYMDNILEQLKSEHFDRMIDTATKYIPTEAREGLIDGIISGRCESLQISALTANEKLFLLAHMNLELINFKAESVDSEFIKIIYSIIHKRFAGYLHS